MTACGVVAGDCGHPRCPTAAAVERLWFFLHECVQWCKMRATGDRVCGATLRRRLIGWSSAALLRRVHPAVIRMKCSGPEAAAAAWDVVLDSCGVRAKRGGIDALLTTACIFVIANRLADF